MNFLYRIKDQFLQTHEELMLVLLIIFVFVGNLVWLIQDTSPATDPDANFYMVRTLAYVDLPEDQKISQLWKSIEDMNMEGRPPLYQLMSVPFVFAFGRSIDSGTYVNLLFMVLLLVASYNIGTLIENKKAGLLAAIVVAGYPTLISLSHNYRPYFAVAACVALNLWLLLLLQKNRSVAVAWLLGLSIAFGFWIYPLFLWVAPIPVAFCVLYITFFQPHSPQPRTMKQFQVWFINKIRQPMVLYGLLPASIVSMALVFAWYQTNAAQLLIVVQNWARSELVTDFRGAKVITLGFHDVPPSFGWYALTSPNSISMVFTILLVVGLALSLQRRSFPDLLLLFFFGTGYSALSLQGGLGWRYFSMLLPVAAVLSTAWIGRIQKKFISLTLFILCFAASVLNYSIVNLGMQPSNDSVAYMLGVVKGPESVDCSAMPGSGFCPSPPVRASWPVSDILETIVKDPDCKKDSCNITIISRTSHIHWTVFTYYLAQDFPGMSAAISSSGNPDMGIPLNLHGLLNDQFLIYEDIPNLDGTTFDETLIRFLLSQPVAFADAHKEVGEFALPNGHAIKVLKRVKPLTVVEAEQVFDAIDTLDKYKIMQYDILASLYEDQGDLDKAQMYFQQGVLTGGIFQHFARTDIKHIEAAINYRNLIENYQNLIKEYQDILTQDPDNYDAHTELARIFLEYGDCEQSLPHWEARLDIRTDYSTYTDLGDAYLKCERWTDAIEIYQLALEMDSNGARARFGFATALAADGQKAAAFRQFKRVIRDAPNTEYARLAQEWLNKYQE